eukprot:scaffold3605_cov430-Prasinococcus_capsulatus_cf.AAC.8
MASQNLAAEPPMTEEEAARKAAKLAERQRRKEAEKVRSALQACRATPPQDIPCMLSVACALGLPGGEGGQEGCERSRPWKPRCKSCRAHRTRALQRYQGLLSRRDAVSQLAVRPLQGGSTFVRLPGAGEEITEQMYAFVDKGENRVTLRPEMTPSLARMVLAKGRSLLLPVKWFSIPQCWRYENTTRGRKREHYQWNMDIIGVEGITAEVELLAAITLFFRRVGLTSGDVGIKINSRKVMGAVMDSYGVPEEKFAPVCVVVDKLDKIGPDAVKEELLQKTGLNEELASKVIETLSARSIDDLVRMCGSADLPAIKELQKVFELAEHYGFADFLLFDASVVRGLAYYTGIVFECFDRQGVLRAIAGGGRYDKLLSLYGSPKEVPACGFGFGDCVILELLKEKNIYPDLPREVQFVVAAFNEDMRGPAMNVTRVLRESGHCVDLMPEPKKRVDAAFAYADRVGAQKIVFVAPDEYERGMVRVKDLRATEEGAKQLDILIGDLPDVEAKMNQLKLTS